MNLEKRASEAIKTHCKNLGIELKPVKKIDKKKIKKED
tara:strand:- start:2684 stop:2797 length:114 start_codon:yes stop_codon:yes gene_type:complete